MPPLTLPGVNVQWPWSARLVEGDKTVETRRYPMPQKYVGQPLALIETPGPQGRREAGIVRARVTAIVTFGPSFMYEDAACWRKDRGRHLVADDSPFCFDPGKPAWGWPVLSVRALVPVREAPRRRGLVFCSPFKL